MNSPENIKQLLLQDINSLIECPELFAKNPGKDFTRTRKLPAKKRYFFKLAWKEIP